METKLIAVVVLLAVAGSLEAGSRGFEGGEVKPGHYSIKEFHFHVYFRKNFEAERKKEVYSKLSVFHIYFICFKYLTTFYPTC
jgi:hypothetical protein